MRKVKFTQDTFDEKLGRIISEFPILDVSGCRSQEENPADSDTVRTYTLSSPPS